MNETPRRTVRDRALLAVATGLGSGCAPVAPGTAGSLVGLALAWPYLAATAAVSGLGVVAAGRAEALLGSKDPGRIVIDEIAGMLVTLIGVPPTWPLLAAGFLLFRVFDILKPFPCRWAERRLPGGLGVMTDDLLAGAYACLVLHVVLVALERAGGAG
jgi:phosphatidylglycerophosphatase A